MSLSSLLFLLLFLPTLSIFYFLARTVERKNIVLLLFSIVFYAFSGIPYLLLFLILSTIAFFAGLIIESPYYKNSKGQLFLVVALFIIVLFIFKYTDFFMANISSLFNISAKPINIVLPLGISFYIFRLISYVVDIYRGDTEAERDYIAFMLYSVMFMTVLQGPIARYFDVKYEILYREVSFNDIAEGIFRFQVGLAKKVVLADKIGALALSLSPIEASIHSATRLAVWTGSICFTLQMYLDFSAYCDMAIGLGKIFGFDIPENFNYPYIATSVKDFWRRWHITLSNFFRDYVYITLGGNRVIPLRRVLNLLIVWTLTGLWHGASWNFVLWGLFYVPFIVMENIGNKLGIKGIPSLIKHIYTVFIFNLGWVLFRFSDFSQLKSVLSIFFGFGDNELFSTAVLLNLQNNMFLIIVCVLASTPIFSMIFKALEERKKAGTAYMGLISLSKTIIGLFCLFISLLAMAGNSFTPFLYNQF